MCRGRLTGRLIATLTAWSAVATALLLPACRQEEPERSELPQAGSAPKKQSDVLIFPGALHVADDSVNEFVARAMSICGQGEYEPFRLLWSVRESPLTRGQFDEGWQAVQHIEIKALREARLVLPPGADLSLDAPSGAPMAAALTNQPAGRPTEKAGAPPDSNGDSAGEPNTARNGENAEEGETVYLVLAEVSLDPQHPAAKQNPTRELALMLVRERDQWRLASPPKPLRDWIRETVNRPSSLPANP